MAPETFVPLVAGLGSLAVGVAMALRPQWFRGGGWMQTPFGVHTWTSDVPEGDEGKGSVGMRLCSAVMVLQGLGFLGYLAYSLLRGG